MWVGEVVDEGEGVGVGVRDEGWGAGDDIKNKELAHRFYYIVIFFKSSLLFSMLQLFLKKMGGVTGIVVLSTWCNHPATAGICIP